MLPLAGGSIVGQAGSQMRSLRGPGEVAQAGAVVELSPSVRRSGGSSSGGIPARLHAFEAFQGQEVKF